MPPIPRAHSRPTASRSIYRQRARPASCPTLPHLTICCSPERLPVISHRRQTPRARSPIVPISTDWHISLAASASWFLPTSVTARFTASVLRPACWKPPDPISPTLSSFTHYPNVQVCRVFAPALPQATGAFLVP